MLNSRRVVSDLEFIHALGAFNFHGVSDISRTTTGDQHASDADECNAEDELRHSLTLTRSSEGGQRQGLH